MSHNRPLKKLGEIVDILDNQRSPISSEEREKRNQGKSKDQLYPYYGATRQNGWIDDYIFNEELILLGEDGADFYDKEKEPAYIINGKSWVNNHAHVLRGKNGILDNKFLCAYLNVFDYHGYVSGATRLKLNQSSMKNIPIPLPPLATQQLIVAKLDETFAQIDEAITATQANIAQTDELTKSVLNKVFEEGEWEKKKLGKIVDNYDGKRVPIKSGERVNETGKYPYYGASGIIDYVDDYIYDGEFLLISEDGANLVARKYPIAFIATGNFWVNNHAHIVKGKEGLVTNQFLEYYFSKLDISPFITGSAQPKLSQKMMNEIEIPLPPLTKQQEIVDHLDRVFAETKQLKAEYEVKLQQLKELKASVLQSAFEGKLV